jgi:uncharacterized surface protein with fasciclin (FAS1) repeats
MQRPLFLTGATLVAAAVFLGACGDDGDDGASEAPPTTEATAAPSAMDDEPGATTAEADIVDTAVAAGDFTTLATALEAAGLVDTLKGEGPFTVFAPTDAAFEKLPPGTLDELLANPDQLEQILLYHVVPDTAAMAEDVVTLDAVDTAAGAPVTIDASGGGVTLNGTTTVTQPDVEASNGVIHVVDTVLLPPQQ